MVSKRKMAEYVRDHMESIKWREHESGGFIGRLNDSVVHICGSDLSRVVLTVSADNEACVISEPQYREPAPISRFFKNFKVSVLHMDPTPEEPEVTAAKQLKEVLVDIVKYAANQCISKYDDPQWERKQRGRIWYRMSGREY